MAVVVRPRRGNVLRDIQHLIFVILLEIPFYEYTIRLPPSLRDDQEVTSLAK